MKSNSDALLVVDDDHVNCDLMLRRLSKRGFNASMACTGESALECIRMNRIDLVLLDLEMPGMGGLAVLDALRKNYTPAQLPIIMVTGKTSSEDMVEALNAGANDYVTKPIDFPVVLARIQSQLSLKHAEDALRESEERYALAARGANDGLWDWDLLKNKAYFSPRWKQMLGWDENDIGDDPDEWLKRVHPDDIDRVRADINAHLEGLIPHYEDEYRMLHKDGSFLWMLGRGLAVRNSNEKPYRFAGSQTDITRGKVADVLTGLPNRVLFMDRLSRSFDRAKRLKDKSFALIFLDLDSFKLINDSLGHLVGDQLLVAIADRLESIVRSCDTVARLGHNHTIARLGGDEFTILLEDISSPQDSTSVAERIQKGLSAPFLIGGMELFPTVSMGISLFNTSYEHPEELLRDADTAMYRAKTLGKARYEVFDETMRASTMARLQLETELRRGLERDEFENYYQALVCLETGQIRGFEALIRWNHPVQGLIMPSEFIPIAEETGLVVPLGQTVLKTACRQVKRWHGRFSNRAPLQVGVNLSARNFLEPDLLDQCGAILHETQIPQGSLSLEVTESAMMHDPESAINLMNNLKSLGIQIALDDFGTGYSSLSYLHRFPLDSVKIDRSFVSRMMDDDEIVRAIITLGRNLGLKVVAEGVETADQLRRLRELGCVCGQGFYFSAPLDAEEATDLIAADSRW